MLISIRHTLEFSPVVPTIGQREEAHGLQRASIPSFFLLYLLCTFSLCQVLSNGLLTCQYFWSIFLGYFSLSNAVTEVCSWVWDMLSPGGHCHYLESSQERLQSMPSSLSAVSSHLLQLPLDWSFLTDHRAGVLQYGPFRVRTLGSSVLWKVS